MTAMENLGRLWNSIQTRLFPTLEDELGELDEKHRQFVSVCELCTLFKIADTRGSRVLIDVLGDDFDGVIGCDYFSAYRKYMNDCDIRVQFYLAYFAPHAPMEDPPHYMERMAHVEEYERRMGLASILAMDDGVGTIRQWLKDMGIDGNTLIFYISDNGAPLREGAYVGSLNDPLVGEKGMQTDGGQRVPFIAAWPGRIPGGQLFEQAVWRLDASATTLAVAGGHPRRALEVCSAGQ